MKKGMILFGIIVFLLGALGCQSTPTTATTYSVPTVDTSGLIDDYETYDDVLTASEAGWVSDHQCVTIIGNEVTIQTSGIYYLTGAINNAIIIVDADNDADVVIVVEGLSISNTSDSILVVENANQVTLNVKENTVNDWSLSSTSITSIPLIESKDDLVITGTGKLTLTNSSGDGINAHDDLIIGNGHLFIHASHHGIEVNNQLSIVGGELVIEAMNDGIHCENNDDNTISSILIMGGLGQLSGDSNGLYSSGSIFLSDGEYEITGGSSMVSTVDYSQVAIKAGGVIQVDGGTYIVQTIADGIHSETSFVINDGALTVDSGDDAIHTTGELVINSGTITITADEDGLQSDESLYILGGIIEINAKKDGLNAIKMIEIQEGIITINATDDGVHADESILIMGGTLSIIKSYEGLESLDIEIRGGLIDIQSSDDGINAVDETATSFFNPGGMGASGSATLLICGGTTYVNASGDGIDINGSITMTDGLLIVCGPTNNANGALDYDSTFVISGGTLIATGSSGMAQNISSSSSQCGVLINLTSTSNQLVTLLDDDGDVLVAFDPVKSYQSIVISTPEMRKNHTYQLYIGGSISNQESVQYDCYVGGTLSGGTLKSTFTQTATATSVGSTMGGRP